MWSETYTSAGIRLMTEMLTGPNHQARYNSRPGVRDVALLITDGHSNIEPER